MRRTQRIILNKDAIWILLIGLQDCHLKATLTQQRNVLVVLLHGPLIVWLALLRCLANAVDQTTAWSAGNRVAKHHTPFSYVMRCTFLGTPHDYSLIKQLGHRNAKCLIQPASQQLE